MPISYLHEPDARELITLPVPEFPDIYPDEVIETIFRLTRCQPYLIQLLCSLLVHRLNAEHRRQVTPADMNIVLPQVFTEGSMYFREFWNLTLLPEERELLVHLVKGVLPEKNEQTQVRRLIQKEILEKAGGSYQFQVPLIQRFVELKAEEES